MTAVTSFTRKICETIIGRKQYGQSINPKRFPCFIGVCWMKGVAKHYLVESHQ